MNSQQVKALKYNRLKPEERFMIDIFDCLVKEESLKYKGEFLYIKDEYCYFYHNQKNQYIWYDYNRIYSVFESEFKYNHNETNVFVKGMVEKHLKLMGITTGRKLSKINQLVEKHLKLMGITTKHLQCRCF